MKVIQYLRKIFQKSSGQAMVEYALIAVFIGLAMVWVANNYVESTKVNYYNGMVPLSKGQALPPPPEGTSEDAVEGNKKPVAVINGPLKGTIGKKLVFTDESYDLDGTIENTSWGSKTIERTFNKEGTYRIELEVIDNKGAKGRVEIEVVISDSIPVAVISKDKAMKFSQSSTLSIHGKESYDPTGDKLVSSKWYLTHPNGSRELMNWGLEGHTFKAGELAAGIYKIELQVRDEYQNDSLWAVDTFQINIIPVAKLTINPKNLNIGQTVVISGSGSYDPDGDALTEVKWTLIRPDGSKVDMNWSLSSLNSYVPTMSGTHRVELKVKDAYNDWSITVTDSFVVKSAPTAVITRSPVKSSYSSTETISFNGLNSFDPDGDSITAVEWYRVKNGVRTKLSWNINGGNFIAKNISGSGTYVFELRVRDSSGLWSEFTSVTIVINNAPPTVTRINDSGNYLTLRYGENNERFVSPNTNFDLYTTHSDPDGETIVEAEWYIIRDGMRTRLNMTSTRITLNASQLSQNGQNVFEVRVKDANGAWSSFVSSRVYIVNERPIISAIYTYGPWPLIVNTSGTHDPDGYIVQIEVKREVHRTNGQIETDYVNWYIGTNYVYGHPNYRAGETAYFYFRVKDNKGEWSYTDGQGYLVN